LSAYGTYGYFRGGAVREKGGVVNKKGGVVNNAPLQGAWLDAEAAADAGLARILPYVRPTLEHLRCDLRPPLLARLAALHCGALRPLDVSLYGRRGERAHFGDVVDWLVQQPLLPLESLRIEGAPFGSDAAATQRAMGVFARLPALRRLELERRTRRRWIDDLPGATVLSATALDVPAAGRGSGLPLGQSRRVSVDIVGRAGLALSLLLPRVEVLYLDGQSAAFGLHRVTQLATLRTLTVHVAGRWLTRDELSTLQSLTQLRTLWLTGSRADASDPMPLQLPPSLLGQLEELGNFYTHQAPQQRLLADYGCACPNVRSLLIDNEALWHAAERRSPTERFLFPKLERLAVRRLTLVGGADHANSR
jgi:hypothetical protein